MGTEPREVLIGSEVLLLYKVILRVENTRFGRDRPNVHFLLALGQKSPKSGQKKQIAVKNPISTEWSSPFWSNRSKTLGSLEALLFPNRRGHRRGG